MVDVLQSFQDHERIEAFILENLKKEKEPDSIRMIDKYAPYFIEEFKHFARIHGFIQPSSQSSHEQK